MKRSILRPVVLLTGVISILFVNSLKAQDLESAIRLIRSENYDKAEEMLKSLIQKNPSDSKDYFYLGENYLLDYWADTISNSLVVAAREAQQAYDDGVKANPNDPLNYIGQAKVASYLGDEAKADQLRAKAKSFLLPYKKIKKISPPAPVYAFTLAKLAESYEINGSVDTSKALPLIREAVMIDSKNADIYLIAGDIYMLINDGSDAIRNYNLAQFADPASPTANMKIGYVYMKARALKQAIPYFEEAIKLNPDYAPAYRELGSLYSRAGRLEQSKEYYKKYLELSAGNIPAQIRYVTSLFYTGDYDEVLKNVEEILAVDKSRSYLNRIAAYSCYEKADPDYNKAEDYMNKLFASVSPDRILRKDYYYMARILVKKNQDYPSLVDDLNNMKSELDRNNSRLVTAPASEKPKIKAAIEDLNKRIAAAESGIAAANKDIDLAFVEYNKALNFDKKTQGNSELTSQDRSLLSEMATTYYNFRRYNDAAKTWAKLIDPSSESSTEDYMRVGRAFYNGGNYKSADSVFQIVLKKSPDYIPALTYDARTYSRMDPDFKMGLAEPKFKKLLQVAQKDSVKNAGDIIEALRYLGYLNMNSGNYTMAKDYYNRMINLDPNDKENKINGYNGLAGLESKAAGQEKTLEGKLAFLARAAEAYDRIIALDPGNDAAKSNLKWVQEYQASVKKGINPNEIKGKVTDTSNKPIAYASVRVKDTAAENYTNVNGDFKFEIPQGSEILIFSAKGYKTQEIAITKSRTYNVKLEQ